MGKIRITGAASGLDTDAMVKELVNAYEEKGQKYKKAKTKTEWKQEAWATLNTKIKSFYTKQASNMRFSTSYMKKKTTISDSSKASVVSSDGAVNGTQTLEVKKLATSGYLTGAQLTKDKKGNAVTGTTTLANLGYEGGETWVQIGQGKKAASYDDDHIKKFEVNGSTTIDEFVNCVKAAGYNASFDSANGRLFISSKESGDNANFNFIDGGEGSPIEYLGLTEKFGNDGKRTADSAVKIEGENAEIELNGATFSSGSNTFTVNGLTITAKELTSGPLSLVTDTDYDQIYDNIKNFFKEYNSLINEMDKLFNAKSSKGYEPLTSEEKEAMTDEEVKLWEQKIKDSLLRNDSDLDKIASTMRNAMLGSFEIDGKKYSLSSFGIGTLGYFEAADNEKNAYHIDGNPDDPDKSGETDKLRAMIASDPETTMSFFQQLSTKLYNAMNKIESVSDNYTSYGNFYNDKKLTTEYTDQTKQIDKWEKYVADIEEKYYKQFTAMESAMSSLQSQQSYISQLFAG